MRGRTMAEPDQLTLKLPGRAVADWEKWRLRLPAAATAGAAIELALKLALEASESMDGLELMVNPKGAGRPAYADSHWVRPRPDGGVEVMTGGHIGRRLEPGESATPIGGDPIRSTFQFLQDRIGDLRDRIEALEKAAE